MLSIMGNPAEEKGVFAGFLCAAPLFADGALTGWCQPKNDPPDIECDLADGRKIGIELTSWLEESRIGRAKIQEAIEKSMRDAIKPERPNQTEHIHFVWMSPKRRVPATDAGDFRAETLNLTAEIERRWNGETDWHTPQGLQWNDFSTYPTLEKYLQGVRVHPRIPSRPTTMEKGGLHWLTFPMRGGAYSPNWMVDSLCECVRAKVAKYPAKPGEMDAFYLLVHYDKALEYNTPVEGINFGYREAVQAAASRIGSSVGVFDRIFVFVPIAEKQQGFSLYPA